MHTKHRLNSHLFTTFTPLYMFNLNLIFITITNELFFFIYINEETKNLYV